MVSSRLHYVVDDRNRIRSGLFAIESETEFCPSTRAMLRTSSTVSTTCPTSPKVTVEPFRCDRMMRLKSLTFVRRPMRAQRDFGGPGNEGAAGNFDVLTLNGLADLVHRQAVGIQPVGIQQQLDLPAPIAGELHARRRR